MTRRRRSELLPPPDFTSHDLVKPGGLSFTGASEDGKDTHELSLESLPGAIQLRRELIAAMAELNGPAGYWRSIHTLRNGHNIIRVFLEWMHSNGHHPESIADIEARLWNSWVLHNGGSATPGGESSIRGVRTVLKASRRVSDDLGKAMARRVGKAHTPLQDSYSEEKFRWVRRQARKVIHSAARRISANYALVLRRQSGEELSPIDLLKADSLIELLETGEVSDPASAAMFEAVLPSGFVQLRLLRRQLFMTPHEGWAAAVLLAAEAGWNASVIDKLSMPDNSIGAGEDVGVYTIALHKPRRGAHQYSSTTVLANSELGRALTWIMTSTEPARTVLERMGKPADRLIISGRCMNYSADDRFRLGFYTKYRESKWDSPATAIPAALLTVSLRTLRRTRQVVFDRTPIQNTRRTHEDVYVRNDRATQDEAEGIVATGLKDALARAEEDLCIKVLTERQASREINSGQLDTVIAACCDYERHPVTGMVCTDSFLACLGCSNAVATPRHLKRLVLMNDALEELGSAIDPEEWRARWEIHFVRLRTLLERHTTSVEQATARAQATEADRAMITRLLNGGFTAA